MTFRSKKLNHQIRTSKHKKQATVDFFCLMLLIKHIYMNNYTQENIFIIKSTSKYLRIVLSIVMKNTLNCLVLST